MTRAERAAEKAPKLATRNFASPLIMRALSLRGFFERIGLDNWTHAGQFGEVQRVLGIGWRSCRPALKCSTSGNELYRCDLNGIECRTDHNQLTVRRQAVDQLGHRFGARSCCQDYLRAPEFLQFLRCVGRTAIDVDIRTKLLCEIRIFGIASNRRDLVTELIRILNSKVSQAADTLHSNKIQASQPPRRARAIRVFGSSVPPA